MRAALLLSLILLPLMAAAAPPRLERLAGVPQIRLPAAELKQQIATHKAEPLRYAVGHALALDERNGVWDEAAPGIARWRLRLSSEGARSLSLHLKDLQLPNGAQLWLAGADGQDLQGPFTAAAVRSGELWLPIVRASEAVLEVQLPTASQTALRLKLVEAFHGYRSLTAAGSPGKAGPGGSESGACNLNVACPAGNDWRPEIRATVYLATPESLCSGSLVNNTRLDERPLILTANHCGIRSINVASLTAYFNLQSSTCSSNDRGRVDQNLAGASVLARDSNSDFTLLTLAGPVPASFNALYAGWDARSTATPQSGVTIHHPSGDEKKISVYSRSASKVDDEPIGSGPGGFTVDAWQVQWTQGTTEGGSSGSPLWNQDHRVVGVLSGGGASCADPTAPDFFARLERGWNGGGTSATRLRDHLDPVSSGALCLDSKEPGATSASTSCASGGLGGSGGSGGGAFGALLLLLPALWRRRPARR